MPKHIMLSTPSAFLRIQLSSENCTLELSKDRQSLFIDQTEEKTISEVELQLNNDLEHTTITSMTISSRYNSFTQRVRIDSLFPLIFEENEEIVYMEMNNLDLFNFPANMNEFSLNITVLLGRDISIPKIAVVHTESILVESRVISVSKELLAISSEYFTSFFYGNYQENGNEIKSIKEISYYDFVRFMKMLHKRKFEIPSVELCLIALGFADYFGFMEVVSKTVPYLLANELPEHLLNQGLELADKLPNNTEILEWALKHILHSDNFFEVLHDSLPFISPQTSQYCLTELLENLSRTNEEEVNPSHHYFPDVTSLEASLTRGQIGIELSRCERSYIVDRKFFVIPNSHPSSHFIRITVDDIWPHVPNDVNRIDCFGGPSFTRDDYIKTYSTSSLGNPTCLTFFYDVQSGAIEANNIISTAPSGLPSRALGLATLAPRTALTLRALVNRFAVRARRKREASTLSNWILL